jgi:hypothetical protein
VKISGTAPLRIGASLRGKSNDLITYEASRLLVILDGCETRCLILCQECVLYVTEDKVDVVESGA